MRRLVHGSCAVRSGLAVLIRGAPGSGKSDLLLRLLDCGFALLADDQVALEDGIASAPERLLGMIEVRGLGVYRLPYAGPAPLGLVAQLGTPPNRIAIRTTCPELGVPLITVDPARPAAAHAIRLAVDCLRGQVEEIAGPLA